MMTLNHLCCEKKIKENTLFLKKTVTDKHFDTLIDSSSYVQLENAKPVVFLKLDDPGFDELLPYLQGLKFSQSTRKALGNGNKSILFGAVTSKINHDNFCNVGATVSKSPLLNNLLQNKYSVFINELMKIYLPQYQKIGKSILNKSGIHNDWKMMNSIWTSGIINKNSPHNFHTDNENARNVYSAMITLKNNVSGGYLVMPEYKTAFKVSNRSVIFFCGKDIVHGVSPINLHARGYRYSIVYYQMSELSQCGSYEQEIIKSIS